MWKHAEVAGLLDRQGCVRVVSRNESEAIVHDVVGRSVFELLAPGCRAPFEAAFAAALAGEEVQGLFAGVADGGFVFWGRVRLMPSPEPNSPVLFHMRRLPRSWDRLTHREREVVGALHRTGMNAKRAAKELGISINTLNAHRRSICQKCRLQGVGDFWVFVQRCR